MTSKSSIALDVGALPHFATVVAYNPMSLLHSRFEYVLSEMPWTAVVAFDGTCQKQQRTDGELVALRSYQIARWLIREHGHAHRNCKAGIAIAVTTIFIKPASIRRAAYTTKPGIHGRGFLFRVVQGSLDYSLFCGYMQVYQGKVTTQHLDLLNWMDKALRHGVTRTTPVVMGDMNCQIGGCREQGRVRKIQSHAVGPFFKIENELGTKFCELLEGLGIFNMGTFESDTATLYGPHGNTTIDCVCIPAHAYNMQSARNFSVLTSFDRKNMFPTTFELVDHVPMSFQLALQSTQHAEKQHQQWDRDAMTEAIIIGTRRDQYIVAVED